MCSPCSCEGWGDAICPFRRSKSQGVIPTHFSGWSRVCCPLGPTPLLLSLGPCGTVGQLLHLTLRPSVFWQRLWGVDFDCIPSCNGRSLEDLQVKLGVWEPHCQQFVYWPHPIFFSIARLGFEDRCWELLGGVAWEPGALQLWSLCDTSQNSPPVCTSLSRWWCASIQGGQSTFSREPAWPLAIAYGWQTFRGILMRTL